MWRAEEPRRARSHLLHGLSDDPTAWVRYTSIERHAPGRLMVPNELWDAQIRDVLDWMAGT